MRTNLQIIRGNSMDRTRLSTDLSDSARNTIVRWDNPQSSQSSGIGYFLVGAMLGFAYNLYRAKKDSEKRIGPELHKADGRYDSEPLFV